MTSMSEPESTSIFSESAQSIIDNMGIIVDQLMGETGLPGSRLTHLQTENLLRDLPHITGKEVDALEDKDSMCPICFTSFLVILTEEETALALDSPAHPIEELGVTKLSQSWHCGHMFCRRDISKWIRTGHDSCPVCRRSLLDAGESSTSMGRGSRQPDVNVNPETQSLSAVQGQLAQIRADIQHSGTSELVDLPEFLLNARFWGYTQTRTRQEGHPEESSFTGMYS